MTKILKIFIIFSLSLSCVAASAQGYSISPVNADAVLKKENIRANVEYLCAESLGGRATGTEGGRKTASWLEGNFRVLGLQPLGGAWMHGFNTSEGMARNVIGLIPGSAQPARYVVLMAHYDNLGFLNGSFYPGADSNASGVAALLEIAGMVNRMNTCHKIYRNGLIVVALDAKEKNQGGAAELWRLISSGKLLDPVSGSAVTPSQISLVVNLDQLGGTLAPLTLLVSAPPIPRWLYANEGCQRDQRMNASGSLPLGSWLHPLPSDGQTWASSKSWSLAFRLRGFEKKDHSRYYPT